ncbi:MAG: hypothetical protein LBS74_11050 [Oscillospiraceae bacterium]|nr:hypothetical protein [Oscillospiraceae bacterium]
MITISKKKQKTQADVKDIAQTIRNSGTPNKNSDAHSSYTGSGPRGERPIQDVDDL